jgi:putative ABC transport system permease protein
VIGFVPLRHRAKSARRDRARSGLMLAQCSGAVALVVLSLMLTRSVIRLVSLDLGWNAAGIMSLNIVPEVQGRTLDRHLEWSDRLLAELRARPEVAAAALTTQVPLSTTLSYTDVFAEGRRDAGSEDARWSGVRHAVTDGYFELMGIRLIRGRTFDPSDRFAAAQFVPGAKNDRGVVIVSESVARTLWPGQSALGRAIRTPNIDNVAWREVVGVVEDIQFHAVGEAPALHLFVPYSQTPIPAVRLLVRGRDRDTVLDAAIQAAAQAAAPGTRIDQVSSLDALVSRATAQPRFTARTVAAFGLLALVLAAVGIYGTLSYIVGARMREIAIRLSLGASRGVIVPDVLRRGLTPVLVGGVIGVFIAAVIARTFETLLFQIEPLDAVSFAIGAALLLCAALAAALAPAIRVLRVNPATALRAE